MNRTAIAIVIATVAAGGPAFALDEPVAWRDPDSGCAYWLTPQGGIAPRFRRDGQPDCPDVRAALKIPDQAIDEAARVLEQLQREMERLAERLGRR
jgi:hypothetical protein